MRSLRNSTDFLLESPVVEVRFCGFRATTLELQNNGWSLAIEQMRHYGSDTLTIRLIMQHAQAKLYALADAIFIDTYRVFSGNPESMAEFFRHRPFEVRYVSPGFKFHVMPMDQMPSFQAFYARPSISEVNFKEIDLEDLKIFKPINPDVEIIVDQKSVGELLEIIKKKQAPSQAEIRERIRQERARSNVRSILEGYDPRTEIKAQLVCIK